MGTLGVEPGRDSFAARHRHAVVAVFAPPGVEKVAKQEGRRVAVRRADDAYSAELARGAFFTVDPKPCRHGHVERRANGAAHCDDGEAPSVCRRPCANPGCRQKQAAIHEPLIVLGVRGHHDAGSLWSR